MSRNGGKRSGIYDRDTGSNRSPKRPRYEDHPEDERERPRPHQSTTNNASFYERRDYPADSRRASTGAPHFAPHEKRRDLATGPRVASGGTTPVQTLQTAPVAPMAKPPPITTTRPAPESHLTTSLDTPPEKLLPTLETNGASTSNSTPTQNSSSTSSEALVNDFVTNLTCSLPSLLTAYFEQSKAAKDFERDRKTYNQYAQAVKDTDPQKAKLDRNFKACEKVRDNADANLTKYVTQQDKLLRNGLLALTQPRANPAIEEELKSLRAKIVAGEMKLERSVLQVKITAIETATNQDQRLKTLEQRIDSLQDEHKSNIASLRKELQDEHKSELASLRKELKKKDDTMTWLQDEARKDKNYQRGEIDKLKVANQQYEKSTQDLKAKMDGDLNKTQDRIERKIDEKVTKEVIAIEETVRATNMLMTDLEDKMGSTFEQHKTMSTSIMEKFNELDERTQNISLTISSPTSGLDAFSDKVKELSDKVEELETIRSKTPAPTVSGLAASPNAIGDLSEKVEELGNTCEDLKNVIEGMEVDGVHMDGILDTQESQQGHVRDLLQSVSNLEAPNLSGHKNSDDLARIREELRIEVAKVRHDQGAQIETLNTAVERQRQNVAGRQNAAMTDAQVQEIYTRLQHEVHNTSNQWRQAWEPQIQVVQAAAQTLETRFNTLSTTTLARQILEQLRGKLQVEGMDGPFIHERMRQFQEAHMSHNNTLDQLYKQGKSLESVLNDALKKIQNLESQPKPAADHISAEGEGVNQKVNEALDQYASLRQDLSKVEEDLSQKINTSNDATQKDIRELSEKVATISTDLQGAQETVASLQSTVGRHDRAMEPFVKRKIDEAKVWSRVTTSRERTPPMQSTENNSAGASSPVQRSTPRRAKGASSTSSRVL